VGKDAAELDNTKSWHAAGRHRSGWRKKTGEAMAWKWAEQSYEEEEGRWGKW